MKFLNTLYAKMTATFLILVVMLGLSLLFVSLSISERYSQEVMQRLNKSVAMYVNEQQALIDNGDVVDLAFDGIMSRAMILNPSLEFYILDMDGKILGHRMPSEEIQLEVVDIEPINDYLSHGKSWPILGTDPLHPDKLNIFSVSPIVQSGEPQGYVYAIIGGRQYQNLHYSVIDSYTLRAGGWLMIGAVVAASVIGCLVFFFLTRRLTRLRLEVNRFNPNTKEDNNIFLLDRDGASDEINELYSAFGGMTEKINQQFESFRELDQNRRELIANISHDLRTPLSSMQGYIELLLVKNSSLDTDQRHEYLDTAFKHCKRLGEIVSELFELSKLESNNVKLNMEPFSLLELVYDCVQEFSLMSKNQQIDLNVVADEMDFFVVADIAMIHHVIQNLLDNALSHTPRHGSVEVQVTSSQNGASIIISDTGKGIQSSEIPHIFERYYQSQQQQHADKAGAGIGLTIVKRILDLHECDIQVMSELNKGTSFVFELPKCQPAAA